MKINDLRGFDRPTRPPSAFAQAWRGQEGWLV